MNKGEGREIAMQQREWEEKHEMKEIGVGGSLVVFNFKWKVISPIHFNCWVYKKYWGCRKKILPNYQVAYNNEMFDPNPYYWSQLHSLLTPTNVRKRPSYPSIFLFSFFSVHPIHHQCTKAASHHLTGHIWMQHHQWRHALFPTLDLWVHDPSPA